jgi:hypothetical protein
MLSYQEQHVYQDVILLYLIDDDNPQHIEDH